MWNRPYRDWLSENFSDKFLQSSEEHSKIYLEQTGKQFFETVDQVLKRNGIPKKRVKDLAKKISNDFYDIKEFCDLVAPIYEELRNMGYTKHELTG